MKFYAVIQEVYGTEISIDQLFKLMVYVRTELTRDKKEAIEKAKERIGAVAVEEIGKGIIWVKSEI